MRGNENTNAESDSDNGVGIVIQARMTSTRLPGKVLTPVYGEIGMLELLLRRLHSNRRLHNYRIIVATTVNKTDDPITDLCNDLGIPFVRGSEDNVLSRYGLAAETWNLQTIARVTSDCPLLDPDLVADIIEKFRESQRNSEIEHRVDYLSNVIMRTYPQGYDTEVFSRDALDKSLREAFTQCHFEHVTQYIIQNPQTFGLQNYPNPDGTNTSHFRVTVDEPNDLLLVREILARFGRAESQSKIPSFNLQNVLGLLKNYPELASINANVQQKQP